MRVDNLEQRLKAHVIGQDEAVNQVSQAIRRARTGARNPNRPIASLLFSGTSGVGKTKLTQAIAIELYGSKESLVRVDMGGLMAEKHFLSLFTDSVGGSHYKVILLCEIENAPPAIAKSLLQIIDNGEFEFPGKKVGGKISFPSTTPGYVDFRNAIIIMTSNIGQPLVTQGLTDSEMRQRIPQNLTGIFRAPLLYRIDEIVLFKMLAKEDQMLMVDGMVRELADRMKKSKLIEVKVTDELKNKVIALGYSDAYGAKQLKWGVYPRLVEDPLADGFLKDRLHPGWSVTVGYSPLYESLFPSLASISDS